MPENRGKAGIVFDNESSAADPAHAGAITIVAPFGGQVASRPADELAAQLAEKQVNSVKDVCEAFDVRIEGTYTGADGEPVQASIPVTDESTFTPDGLVRNDPGLFRIYVEAVTSDRIAAYLAERDRDHLSEAEIRFLREAAEVLARSVEEQP